MTDRQQAIERVEFHRDHEECTRNETESGFWRDVTRIIKAAKDLVKAKKLLNDARADMWQTYRVNHQNLTGVDPLFPNDPPLNPNPPQLIHQPGLNDTINMINRIEEFMKETYE